MVETTLLRVAPDLLQMGLSAAALVVRQVDNTRTAPELVAYRRAFGQKLAAYWKNRSISAHPAIEEYHRVHQQVGVTGEPPSPEKLILYIRRHRDLNALTAVVDCYNLVSARTLLSLGAHDLDKLATPVTLRRFTAEDVFVPLGKTEERRLPGEYGYVDPQGRIICRLEVLQGDYSKTTRESRNVFIILQGNRCLPAPALLKGTWLLAEMIEKFCGGKAELVSFNDAGPFLRPTGIKPHIAIDSFKHLNLQVGTLLRAEALPNLPALSVATVRLGQEIEALALSSLMPVRQAGQQVIVAAGLHPLTLAGKSFRAYLLGVQSGATAEVLQVAGPIPDGSRLY
jgi:DNA/RNA-binding domain of Phe-tRNA-synthetase-like protein